MKGATYVTVEADAAFVMPMNASGGSTDLGYVISWITGEEGGLTGKGWSAGDLTIDAPYDNENVRVQIESFFDNISTNHNGVINALMKMNCIAF